MHINLNLAKQARDVCCDLTEEYVDFKQSDVTDSASLGDNDFDQLSRRAIIFRCLEFAASKASAHLNFMRK